MSAATAYRAPAAPTTPAPAPRPRRDDAPRLRVVRAPQHARTRVPFVVACMAVLGAALLSALLLNTQMASAAYEKFDLSNELGRLEQDQKDLMAELDAKASPDQLAEAAKALGLVPAANVGWVRLSDGTVLGTKG
jgi:hypothetical protein